MSSSNSVLAAFAIGPAGAAMRLSEKIQRIASGFSSDIHPINAISCWLEVSYALLEFDMEMEGVDPNIPRMFSRLDSFFNDVVTGRPSITDNFRKAKGQKSSSAVDNSIIQCCVAITLLMKSGKSLEEAARIVARFMTKAGLALPPARSKEQTGWRSLVKRREKLISHERDDLEARAYHSVVASFQDTAPEQCRAKAMTRLHAVASIYGKTPNNLP